MCLRGAEHRSVKEPPTLRDRPGPRRRPECRTQRQMTGTWRGKSVALGDQRRSGGGGESEVGSVVGRPAVSCRTQQPCTAH